MATGVHTLRGRRLRTTHRFDGDLRVALPAFPARCVTASQADPHILATSCSPISAAAAEQPSPIAHRVGELEALLAATRLDVRDLAKFCLQQVDCISDPQVENARVSFGETEVVEFNADAEEFAPLTTSGDGVDANIKPEAKGSPNVASREWVLELMQSTLPNVVDNMLCKLTPDLFSKFFTSSIEPCMKLASTTLFESVREMFGHVDNKFKEMQRVVDQLRNEQADPTTGLHANIEVAGGDNDSLSPSSLLIQTEEGDSQGDVVEHHRDRRSEQQLAAADEREDAADLNTAAHDGVILQYKAARYRAGHRRHYVVTYRSSLRLQKEYGSKVRLNNGYGQCDFEGEYDSDEDAAANFDWLFGAGDVDPA